MMASVSSTRSNDSYEAEWAQVQDRHERSVEKNKQDEEKELTEAKNEYQARLKNIRDEASAEVRKLKEDSYDSYGRRVANIEHDNLEEKKRITDAFGEALDKSQQSRKEQEKLYEAKLTNALSEANERTVSQVKTQKSEFVKLANEKRQEADQAKKFYETEIENEKIRSHKNNEIVVKNSDIAIEKAMSEQGDQYNKYLLENRKNANLTLDEKNKTIADLRNTSDLNKISPEAKKKIESSYQKRFDDELALERSLSTANQEALKKQNHQFRESVRSGYTEQFNDMSRDLRLRHQLEKNELVKGYEDLASSAEMTQKKLENHKVDQSQRSYQKHTTEMTLQEQRNQERLKEQRISLTDDRYKEKEDLENKQRVQDREWSYKITDTRREYEKKIVDQKDLHDQEMEKSKFEFDKKLQDQQRTAKRLLDERVRAYEAQMKMQESTFKEHERLLTEHYDEELDKMKRTNARITQAKS